MLSLLKEYTLLWRIYMNKLLSYSKVRESPPFLSIQSTKQSDLLWFSKILLPFIIVSNVFWASDCIMYCSCCIRLTILLKYRKSWKHVHIFLDLAYNRINWPIMMARNSSLPCSPISFPFVVFVDLWNEVSCSFLFRALF
jgi:hypothetical protein